MSSGKNVPLISFFPLQVSRPPTMKKEGIQTRNRKVSHKSKRRRSEELDYFKSTNQLHCFPAPFNHSRTGMSPDNFPQSIQSPYMGSYFQNNQILSDSNPQNALAMFGSLSSHNIHSSVASAMETSLMHQSSHMMPSSHHPALPVAAGGAHFNHFNSNSSPSLAAAYLGQGMC